MKKKLAPPVDTNAGNSINETGVNKKRKVAKLSDFQSQMDTECRLGIARLGNDETAIIPFTEDILELNLHYVQETEVNGYIPCLGPKCVLCRIGRKAEPRLALPVYLPAEGCVSVLLVSKSFRPFALLPQLQNVLNAGKPMVMFISRDGAKYSVSSNEIRPGTDDGAGAIKKFLDAYSSGDVDLAGVFPQVTNEQLAGIDEIGRMMELKGVSLDA